MKKGVIALLGLIMTILIAGLLLSGCGLGYLQTENDTAWQNTVRPNAYGLGVNADQYGRPHVYRQQDGTPVDPIFQGGVKRDVYGPGVGQDQFGRPVYDSRP